jgi:hypothetical protein
VVIEAGTVDGVSVVGETVGHFKLALASVSVAAGGITAASFAADTGLAPVHTGTLQAGAFDQVTLAAGASATTGRYDGHVLFITGGTGAGQKRIIAGYNGTTKVATLGTAGWQYTNPDSTSTYAVFPPNPVDVQFWYNSKVKEPWYDGMPLVTVEDLNVNGDGSVDANVTVLGGQPVQINANGYMKVAVQDFRDAEYPYTTDTEFAGFNVPMTTVFRMTEYSGYKPIMNYSFNSGAGDTMTGNTLVVSGGGASLPSTADLLIGCLVYIGQVTGGGSVGWIGQPRIITDYVNDVFGSGMATITVDQPWTRQNPPDGTRIFIVPAPGTIPASVWSHDLGDGRTAEYFQKGGFNKTVRTTNSFTVYDTDDTTTLVAAVSTGDVTMPTLASVDP